MHLVAAKLYCYVDESGQDTQGRLFVVSVVVTGSERAHLQRLCAQIEDESGKGERKWSKTARTRRIAYVLALLAQPDLTGKLYFEVFEDTKDYLQVTVETVARVLAAKEAAGYSATVFVDGLSRPLERAVGLHLRRLGAHVKKTRGLDEVNDPLMRLADAVCGLVRAGWEGDPELHALWRQGLSQGVWQDVSRT